MRLERFIQTRNSILFPYFPIHGDPPKELSVGTQNFRSPENPSPSPLPVLLASFLSIS